MNRVPGCQPVPVTLTTIQGYDQEMSGPAWTPKRVKASEDHLKRIPRDKVFSFA